jgi:Sulfotransferase family
MTAAGSGPIFIGGLSGSGKTQLRMALGAHPAISLTRRTRMWDRFYARFGDLRDPANLERCLATMLCDPGIEQLAPDERRVRRELADGPPTYARLFALLHQHHAERAGCRRWGDQLSGIERFADPIFAAFPSARMVHMVRDPRRRPSPGGGRLGARTAKLGWETAMWLQSVELATRHQRRYPDGYLVVRYEALADRPAETVEAICSFIGEHLLPPMADVAHGLRFDTGDTQPLPPYVAARTLSPADAAFVDRYAGSELARFGYPHTRPRLNGRDRLAFGLATWPLNRAAMAASCALAPRPARPGGW